jgi:hypothetical protein
VNGDVAISGMDFRHLFMILGTDAQHPMTVHSVSVWQQSALGNLTSAAPTAAVDGNNAPGVQLRQ